MYPIHSINDMISIFNQLKCVQAFTKAFCDDKRPHKFGIHFSSLSFFACKILFEDLATHLVHLGIGMFPIIQLFLFLLSYLDVCFCLVEPLQAFSCHLFHLRW